MDITGAHPLRGPGSSPSGSSPQSGLDAAHSDPLRIQDQIKAAMERVCAAYAAKIGCAKAQWACEIKLSSFDKPQVQISLHRAFGERGSAPTVMLFAWDLPERTFDAAVVLAEQRIESLRTIDDENADLYAGLNEEAA